MFSTSSAGPARARFAIARAKTWAQESGCYASGSLAASPTASGKDARGRLVRARATVSSFGCNFVRICLRRPFVPISAEVDVTKRTGPVVVEGGVYVRFRHFLLGRSPSLASRIASRFAPACSRAGHGCRLPVAGSANRAFGSARPPIKRPSIRLFEGSLSVISNRILQVNVSICSIFRVYNIFQYCYRFVDIFFHIFHHLLHCFGKISGILQNLITSHEAKLRFEFCWGYILHNVAGFLRI